MDIKSYIINNNIEHSDILLKILKPSVNITTNKKNSKRNSKFGGLPDVNRNFKYPILNGSPLTFVGQIFLNDLKEFQHLSFIPSNGMLYFFINTNITTRYPDKENEFKVIFSPIPYINALIPYVNENKSKVYDESFLDFHENYSFPSYQDYEVLQLEEKGIDIDDTIDEIIELKSESLGYKSDVGHQIFGNPQALQGTVKFHWAKNQLKYEYPIDKGKQLEINELEEEFELLLQIDFSDKNLNFSELYGGSVAYFGINKKDLMNMNFENVKLCFQNT